MKNFLIAAFCFITSHAAAQRAIVNFNKDWQFLLDSNKSWSPGNGVRGWRTVTLPHDWSIELPFDSTSPSGVNGGALRGGLGWYRKVFSLPATDRNRDISIEFDGVYRNSEVWINGHRLGIRPNGYISFAYELVPWLHYGAEQNEIVVRVDNSKQPNSRWYSGSGIYRDVRLVKTGGTRIEHWGTFVTTPQISDDRALVRINTRVSGNALLKTTVYDAAGKQVATASGRTALDNSQDLAVEHPHLWSLNDPYLYKAVSELTANGTVIDRYETVFGIRYFNFDRDKGFFLNGKPVKILGVCDHHDLGALGSAFNLRAAERQLQMLKSMGVNGIRTSHNPPAPALLDLCDRIGFVVMDEAFDMWALPKTEFDYHLDWKDWHQRDLEDQIFRDRNHPSIFIWSIGNEIPEQGSGPDKKDTSGRVIARELAGIVRALDTTRPITSANNQTGVTNNLILSGALDLVGYNYAQRAWDTFHDRWPGRKMIVSESTSAFETRGYFKAVPSDTIQRWRSHQNHFVNPYGEYEALAYDNVSSGWGSTHEESIKPFLRNPNVSGMYIWTGFDYLGEPTPFEWPARSSYFGIIDLAGFPKDSYWLYQSIFTDKPVLHILPHWNWKVGDTVDVVCYYNHAEEVELFLNGRSLGPKYKSGEELHVTWRVPYAPGMLRAVSRSGGATVLSTETRTAGEPDHLVLKADRGRIHADGVDLSFVTVSVVDKNGILVPRSGNEIHFSASGAGFIAGLDNGDPINHESFKGSQHAALNGLALAILQSNGKKGTITLTASAPGLKGASITVACE